MRNLRERWLLPPQKKKIMELSEILNLLLGGGLVGTVVAIGSLRATVRKAKAEALRAEADAESVRIDNAEHATRILMENIVKPLKDEFNETKKELSRNTREMARLRKAIDAANRCDYRDDCPVLDRLREQPKERGSACGNGDAGKGQHGGGIAPRDSGPCGDGGCGADGAHGQRAVAP